MLADRARAGGDHPFGALLADTDGRVLLEAGNSVVTLHDVTGHAETNLVSAATRRFEAGELAAMTLVASCEPCAMCSGAIYWSGIGAVVDGPASGPTDSRTASPPHGRHAAHDGAGYGVSPKPAVAVRRIRA